MAPFATSKCAFSGTIISSFVKFRVCMNLFLNSDRYVSGPPKNATWPFMGCPQANPEIVWFTTAWNIDAAISDVLAPSLINGWTSVLANTPHLDAIGYSIL